MRRMEMQWEFLDSEYRNVVSQWKTYAVEAGFHEIPADVVKFRYVFRNAGKRFFVAFKYEKDIRGGYITYGSIDTKKRRHVHQRFVLTADGDVQSEEGHSMGTHGEEQLDRREFHFERLFYMAEPPKVRTRVR